MNRISRRACLGLLASSPALLQGCGRTTPTSQTMPDVISFEVSLYFQGAPQLTNSALIQAWREAGYGLEEQASPDHLLKVFRAANTTRGEQVFDLQQMVRLTEFQAIDHGDAPEHYPAVCEPGIDYDATYLSNHQTGWADFQAATHTMRLGFDMLQTTDLQLPHMELVAVLNSIHKLVPIHAMQLHHLGLLVGKVELDEFLDYATDYPDNPPQFCPMLAFGVFCTQSSAQLEGWTTGLNHFGPHEFWMQTPTRPPIDLMRVMFNLGIEPADGRLYQAGESASVAELFVDIRANDRLEPPVLELVLR